MTAQDGVVLPRDRNFDEWVILPVVGEMPSKPVQREATDEVSTVNQPPSFSKLTGVLCRCT